MNIEKEDRALLALLAARREHELDITDDLLRKAYAIQCRHQFDRERDISVQEMQRLLDDYLARQGGDAEGHGGNS